MLLASRKIIEAVDDAFLMLTIASVVLMVGIMAALVMFAVKYHRSRHPKPARIAGNMKLEIAWTVIPTIISMWMFWVGYENYGFIRNPPDGAYEINVEGRQWAWTFTYPDEGNITSSEMYVPVNRAVKCNLSSPDTDVIHSFYLPYFKVKEDCVPGKPSYLWFQPDKIGTYDIFCAEFCGNDHSKMITTLHVVSEEDFNDWLDERLRMRYMPVSDAGAALDPTTEAIVKCNAPVLFKTYCASCHGDDGRGGLVEGARNMQFPKDWKNGPQLANIFRTVTEGLKGTQMRSFSNLSAWDRIALAHHVISFRKGAGWPKDTTIEECNALIKKYKLDEQRVVTREFPLKEAIKEIIGNK